MSEVISHPLVQHLQRALPLHGVQFQIHFDDIDADLVHLLDSIGDAYAEAKAHDEYFTTEDMAIWIGLPPLFQERIQRAAQDQVEAHGTKYGPLAENYGDHWILGIHTLEDLPRIENLINQMEALGAKAHLRIYKV